MIVQFKRLKQHAKFLQSHSFTLEPEVTDLMLALNPIIQLRYANIDGVIVFRPFSDDAQKERNPTVGCGSNL